MFRKSLLPSARALTVLMAILFSACSLFAAEAPRMTKEDLKAKLGSPDLLIIDVRTEKDWKDSAVKIKGALREDPSKSATWLDKFPKDKTLVFYCA